MTTCPQLPGAISMSHVTVYDWPAPDRVGRVGSGTPHLHTASSEAYVVLAGEGRVQTLGHDGFTEHRLSEGEVVWFTPGVVHRLVNDGGLVLLVVMSNAGLPESGDAVLTFPQDVLRDPERYRELATLPRQHVGLADAPDVAAAARARRDLAIEGFAALRAAVDRTGPEALGPLHAAAVQLVRQRVGQWHRVVERGVVDAASGTVSALELMAKGSAAHLVEGTVAAARLRDDAPRYGMCGRLRPLDQSPQEHDQSHGGNA